jgi:hypothetical protein
MWAVSLKGTRPTSKALRSSPKTASTAASSTPISATDATTAATAKSTGATCNSMHSKTFAGHFFYFFHHSIATERTTMIPASKMHTTNRDGGITREHQPQFGENSPCAIAPFFEILVAEHKHDSYDYAEARRRHQIIGTRPSMVTRRAQECAAYIGKRMLATSQFAVSLNGRNDSNTIT